MVVSAAAALPTVPKHQPSPSVNWQLRSEVEPKDASLTTFMPSLCAQALSGMGHVWRKVHTVWVNIGGLHAAVYLLKRTPQAFVHPSEDRDRGARW